MDCLTLMGVKEMVNTIPANSNFSLLLNGNLSMLTAQTQEAGEWLRNHVVANDVWNGRDQVFTATPYVLRAAADAADAGFSIGQPA